MQENRKGSFFRGKSIFVTLGFALFGIVIAMVFVTEALTADMLFMFVIAVGMGVVLNAIHSLLARLLRVIWMISIVALLIFFGLQAGFFMSVVAYIVYLALQKNTSQNAETFEEIEDTQIPEAEDT